MRMASRAIYLLTLCFVSVFTYITAGYAATIKIADHGDGSCSLANAQSAYNAAADGDTILFPSGNCIWNSALTISKPLSVIGAGSGVGGTKLSTPGGGGIGKTMGSGFFHITGITSTSLMRISGFYFEMTDWSPATAIFVNNVNIDNIRIDHNIFNQGSKAILFYNPKGLIDSNYFYNGNLTIEFSAGSVAKANASWDSMAAGTEDALFIEDNHFIDDANYPMQYSNERIGTFNGGKLVVRYNHFDSYNAPLNTTDGTAINFVPVMTHGSAAGGVKNGYWQIGAGARRGQSVVEIYNNVMEGRRIDFPVIVRGSANLIYNNTIKTTSVGSCRIQLREEEYTESSNWSPLRTAWPAEDQVHNTFIWNNSRNGAQMTTVNIVTVPDETKIQLDRDYFLHEPQATGGKATFTGKNGASGTYPTDGVMYPTLGTMVFSAEGPNAYYPYTPYTYPHPLRIKANPLILRVN